MEDPTGLTETADPPEIAPLVEEGTGSIPWEAQPPSLSYTDGLAWGNQCRWAAVASRPATDSIWMDTVDSPGVDGGGATLWGKDPDSQQGTHFMGHEIEAWAEKK